MSLGLFFVACLVISGLAIRVGMTFAGHLGVLDRPGGHKQHDVSTPFVGGFGVFAAVLSICCLSSLVFPELQLQTHLVLALGAAILFATGLADDIWHLNFRTRFVVQTMVALAMVFLGGVELRSLGGLIFTGYTLDLGPLAVPFTIFATVGLINAVNMIDGIDGLSGSLSLISLGLTAVVAAFAGNVNYLQLIIALMGGVAGFLYYNLRYAGNHRARVFLGDNGSMLLGFVFAWLFIALSQGEARAMTPVTALWLFAIPLMDTVAVMLRRIWMGKSPFHADRNHLHHLFLSAGFPVSHTVLTIATIQLVLGAFGVAGLVYRIPEPLMFWLFLAVFGVYFYVIARPWRFVPGLRRAAVLLHLPSSHARGIFIGYFTHEISAQILARTAEVLADLDEHRISLHQVRRRAPSAPSIFALIDLGDTDNDATISEVRRRMLRLKARFADLPGVQVRHYMGRSVGNERRSGTGPGNEPKQTACKRRRERRAPEATTEIYSIVRQRTKRETRLLEV